MIKGAFVIDDPESRNLISWFKTVAVHSQEERKCKVFVAIHEGQVVGYIALCMTFPGAPIEGLKNRTDHQLQMILIGKLYVLPDYRSRGIGGSLLEFALGLAVEVDKMLGCIGLIADANINPRTVSFYQRFGFEEISRTTRYVKMFFKIPPQPIINHADQG